MIILFIPKVDKFWPVPLRPNIKTEEDIKEEPIEITEEDLDPDLDWEREAEQEILAANEEYFDTPPLPMPTQRPEKIKINFGTKDRPKRARTKPKSYKEEFEDSDERDPDEVEANDDCGSLFGDYHTDAKDDPDFDDDDPGSDFSMDMFGEESDEDHLEDDNSNLDLTLVKEEIESMEGEEGGSKADSLLASSQECKVVEIGGLRVETYGDYSKCPKCEKNIKSTFIIRHIKLHDQPSTTMNCPYRDCSTSFTR